MKKRDIVWGRKKYPEHSRPVSFIAFHNVSHGHRDKKMDTVKIQNQISRTEVLLLLTMFLVTAGQGHSSVPSGSNIGANKIAAVLKLTFVSAR